MQKHPVPRILGAFVILMLMFVMLFQEACSCSSGPLVEGESLPDASTQGERDIPDAREQVNPDTNTPPEEKSVTEGVAEGVVEAPVGESISEKPVGPPTPQFYDEQVWSASNDWEPIVITQRNSNIVYQMTTRYGDRRREPRTTSPRIVLRRSSDGGKTWEEDRFPSDFQGNQNDPQLQVADDGTLFGSWLNAYEPGVIFSTSKDGGKTWSAALTFSKPGQTPDWSDKPILLVSPDGKDVYFAMNASDSYTTTSHDGGKTFSKLFKTNSGSRYWFHTAGVIAPNGHVYFAAADYSQNYKGDAHVNVIRSADAGKTWSSARIDTSTQEPDTSWAKGSYLGYFGPTASISADVAGTLMLVYNAGRSSGKPQQIWVRTSKDGVTWSNAFELSNGDPAVNNVFPAVAAGPKAGDFRIVWQDDREGPQKYFNTWYRQTLDGGRTWSSAVRLSNRPDGAPYKSPKGYGFPYGDYLGISVDSKGKSHVIWGASGDYEGPGGCWYTREK